MSNSAFTITLWYRILNINIMAWKEFLSLEGVNALGMLHLSAMLKAMIHTLGIVSVTVIHQLTLKGKLVIDANLYTITNHSNEETKTIHTPA